MAQTDYQPRALPESNIAHAFPLWDAHRSFCGQEFAEGETVETDRATCETCLEELEKIRTLKT